MAWRALTDEQWEKIRVHLPPPKPHPEGGRPRADDRKCFEGILWILWIGAPWSELPRRYGSPSTCWRRLKEWEESGVLLELWRAFLAQLNNQQKICSGECFADGSFAPAKKGGPRWARPKGARARSGWFSLDGAGAALSSILGLGVPGGGEALGEDARHGGGEKGGQARTAPQAPRPVDCRSRFREHPLAPEAEAEGDGADPPRPQEPSQSYGPGWAEAAALQKAVDRGAHLCLGALPEVGDAL